MIFKFSINRLLVGWIWGINWCYLWWESSFYLGHQTSVFVHSSAAKSISPFGNQMLTATYVTLHSDQAWWACVCYHLQHFLELRPFGECGKGFSNPLSSGHWRDILLHPQKKPTGRQEQIAIAVFGILNVLMKIQWEQNMFTKYLGAIHQYWSITPNMNDSICHYWSHVWLLCKLPEAGQLVVFEVEQGPQRGQGFDRWQTNPFGVEVQRVAQKRPDPLRSYGPFVKIWHDWPEYHRSFFWIKRWMLMLDPQYLP